MKTDPPKILIAAGGTGGHIFPALHVARALKVVRPDVQLAFIGAGRPLEEKLIDGAGYKRYVLPAERVMQQGVIGILKFFLTLPRVLLLTQRIFSEFKPDAIIGMGGYVTVPPVFWGKLCGVPTWVHEAEKKPGLANKVLGLIADKVSVAFQDTRMILDRELLVTGHPVRLELKGIAEIVKGEMPQNLLVIGGSQGAKAIDEALEELAPHLAGLEFSVRHQTRAENCERLKKAYSEVELKAQVAAFIDDMPEAYRWADLIISRSGAGAISELAVVNVPAILVPYPFAQGGHQLGNAQVLEKAGKALIVEEGEDFSGDLLRALTDLSQPQKYAEMRSRECNLLSLTAAEGIAKGVLNLAGS